MTESKRHPVEEVHERLSAEEIASDSLLAATHLHRYEFAAELVKGLRVLDLCCGTGYGARILAKQAVAVRGVDIDAESIATARRELEGRPFGTSVNLEQGDALEALNDLDPGGCDAIVCFEGIEHVPDPGALADAMARLAQHGKRLIVSLPNTRGFDEENPFHLAEFGYEEAIDLFDRFGEPTVLSQFLAEGSLLLKPNNSDGALEGQLVPPAQPAPEWANNWLAVVNVPPDELSQVQARLQIGVSANHNGYMRVLERANTELERANARLMRRWLGVHDAAAALTERRVTEAEARTEQLERRLALEIEVAKRNDRYFQDARRALQSPRYQAVDRLRDLLLAVPGAAFLMKRLGQILR